MIRHNEQLWKAAEKERKFNERANELMECFASYVTENGGVRSGECKRYKKNEPRDCESCEAHKAFYKAVRDYIQADGVNSPSEAIWLTCQFYDLPNAYMCDGNEERWLKEYQPKRYEELLKRQAELMGDEPEQEMKKPVRWEKDQLQGQMSIFDFIEEPNERTPFDPNDFITWCEHCQYEDETKCCTYDEPLGRTCIRGSGYKAKTE